MPAPGVAGCALAASQLRVALTGTLETFLCARIFRQGAENRARGGRAPIPARDSDLTGWPHKPIVNFDD